MRIYENCLFRYQHPRVFPKIPDMRVFVRWRGRIACSSLEGNLLDRAFCTIAALEVGINRGVTGTSCFAFSQPRIFTRMFRSASHPGYFCERRAKMPEFWALSMRNRFETFRWSQNT